MNKSFLFLFFISIFASCSDSNELVANYGHTQGTTYAIKYVSEDGRDYQSSIDSILIVIDKSMSLWLDNSVISKVNRGDSDIVVDRHFEIVFKRAIEIAKETKGSFDVSIAPLVKAWGFNNGNYQKLDSTTVDSLHALVNYKALKMRDGVVLFKTNQELDFNGIAQGYSVDVLSEFLESKGLLNYLVEVGGELRAKGKNLKGSYWKIGIDKPQEEIDQSDRFQLVVELNEKSLATSGNYRKFFEDEDGMKYVHTINPKTGYPVKSTLLSTSIITDKCMDADAYATACMVMGLDKSKQLINNNPHLEAYLVYSDNDGNILEWKSENFGVN